jgi:hypothetical protein
MNEIEVRVSEVIHRLREQGEFRRALDEIVQGKVKGADTVTVNVIEDIEIVDDDSGEISDAELKTVAGGLVTTRGRSSTPRITKFKYDGLTGPGPQIPDPGEWGFADTKW